MTCPPQCLTSGTCVSACGLDVFDLIFGECDRCEEPLSASECEGDGFHCEDCREWCPQCQGVGAELP